MDARGRRRAYIDFATTQRQDRLAFQRRHAPGLADGPGDLPAYIVGQLYYAQTLNARGMTGRGLARVLAESRTTVNHHVRRLRAAGVIAVDEDGLLYVVPAVMADIEKAIDDELMKVKKLADMAFEATSGKGLMADAEHGGDRRGRTDGGAGGSQ